MIFITLRSIPQIYTRDPRPPIPPLCNGHGTQFGGLQFLHRPHTQKQMQNQCVHDLLLSLAHTIEDAVTDALEETWLFLLREKTKTPNLSPHAGTKMAQVRGSLVYICGPFIHHIFLAVHCCTALYLIGNYCIAVSQESQIHADVMS